MITGLFLTLGNGMVVAWSDGKTWFFNNTDRPAVAWFAKPQKGLTK